MHVVLQLVRVHHFVFAQLSECEPQCCAQLTIECTCSLQLFSGPSDYLQQMERSSCLSYNAYSNEVHICCLLLRWLSHVHCTDRMTCIENAKRGTFSQPASSV